MLQLTFDVLVLSLNACIQIHIFRQFVTMPLVADNGLMKVSLVNSVSLLCHLAEYIFEQYSFDDENEIYYFSKKFPIKSHAIKYKDKLHLNTQRTIEAYLEECLLGLN